MKDNGNAIVHYLRHRMKARSLYDVHSPFVYSFVTKVIQDETPYEEYGRVEALRRHLLNEPGYITRSDCGARSSDIPWAKEFVHIRSIVKSASISERHGQLLFRTSRHYRPKVCLELGTSLGLSTVYMALGNPEMNIVTVEGCPNTAEVARRNFEMMDLENIDQRVGDFDKLLPGILNGTTIDLVFIDGNHRKEPTVNYFLQLLQHAGEDSVFIFDDIYWSEEMAQAWKVIRAHPAVTVTIDLFRMGFVFFRKGLSKEDFVIRF
jgi:predicted O-methyltransferase YrrM